MIRIAELKLPLAEVPAEHRRAADAPTETDADREPPPHPTEALTRLAAQALGAPIRRILCMQNLLAKAPHVTVIHLGRGSPTRLGATYPPAPRNHVNAGLFGIAARRDCPFHPN